MCAPRLAVSVRAAFPAIQFLQRIALQRPRGVSSVPNFPGGFPAPHCSQARLLNVTGASCHRAYTLTKQKSHNRQDELEIDWPVSFQLCLVACTVPAGAAVDAIHQTHLRKTTMLPGRGSLNHRPPHPVPTYIFKAPNGVGFPALQFLQGIAFHRPRGPFQRSSFYRLSLSSAPRVPFQRSIYTGCRFPAPQRGFPALQFLQGIAFQRPSGAFQRSRF